MNRLLEWLDAAERWIERLWDFHPLLIVASLVIVAALGGATRLSFDWLLSLIRR